MTHFKNISDLFKQIIELPHIGDKIISFIIDEQTILLHNIIKTCIFIVYKNLLINVNNNDNKYILEYSEYRKELIKLQKIQKIIKIPYEYIFTPLYLVSNSICMKYYKSTNIIIISQIIFPQIRYYFHKYFNRYYKFFINDINYHFKNIIEIILHQKWGCKINNSCYLESYNKKYNYYWKSIFNNINNNLYYEDMYYYEFKYGPSNIIILAYSILQFINSKEYDCQNDEIKNEIKYFINIIERYIGKKIKIYSSENKFICIFCKKKHIFLKEYTFILCNRNYTCNINICNQCLDIINKLNIFFMNM